MLQYSRGMKKILVPTDFSKYADKALNYAVCIAKKARAEVILLHARDELKSPLVDGGKKNLDDENNEMIIELTHKLKQYETSIEQTEGVPVTIKLFEGKIVTSIITAAEENKVDLIVMGTLGTTGLKTMIYGTKTSHVISKTSIPVIAIPFDYEWSEPKEFLLAISDAHEDVEIFKPVLELGKLFNSNIKTVIFSNEEAEGVEFIEHSRAISTMQNKLKTAFPETHIEFVHLAGKDFDQTLHDFIKEQNTDLLVMVTHKRSVVQSLFSSSKTKKMSYHSLVPLLSLHSMN